MSLVQLTFIVAVNMMGSGIIMLPTNMAQVGAISLLSWGVTAVGSMAIAYGFAYPSTTHSSTLPARSACPHRPSPFGDREPTGASTGITPLSYTAYVPSIVVELAGTDHG